MYLIAALAAPVLGPVLYRVLHDRPVAVELVDRFVYAAVPLLVAWQVLPHAWDERTPWPVVAVVERDTEVGSRARGGVVVGG